MFHMLTQPFRLLAKLAATSPFRGDILILRNINFSYYYELLYAPCVAAPFRQLTVFADTFPKGQARLIA